eukprot:1796162-Pleurochrysis_carterae.AAC.1
MREWRREAKKVRERGRKERKRNDGGSNEEGQRASRPIERGRDEDSDRKGATDTSTKVATEVIREVETNKIE